MEFLRTVKVNGVVIGTVRTNHSCTVKELMWALGYDIDDDHDCKRGYYRDVEGFYLNDCGNYCFDEEAVEIC
jgi:hypothetical protein